MLTHHLAALEASGLVRLILAQPDLEYVFRHALVQDAASQSILRADRKALHLAVAEALERLHPDRQQDGAALLARPYRAGGEMPRARHCLARAGDAALSLFANAEAERHYRPGLDLPPPDAERAQLLAGLGEALFWQDRFEAAVQIWAEACLAGVAQARRLRHRARAAFDEMGLPLYAAVVERRLAALPETDPPP